MKQIYREGSADTAMEIVGIVDDIQEGQPDTVPQAAMYQPFYKNPENPKYGFAVVLHTSQDEKSVLSMAAAALHGLDAGLAVYDPGTMGERLFDSPSATLHRSAAYVVAYSVSQRTREIGVRMALGAQQSAVQGMILREAGRLTAIGVVLGLAGAVGAARLMGGLLFDVRAWDVPTLVAVVAVLCASAVSASFLPARRAALVNPIEALRAE